MAHVAPRSRSRQHAGRRSLSAIRLARRALLSAALVASPAAAQPPPETSPPPGRTLDHAPAAGEARGLEREPGPTPEDIGLFTPRALLTAPRLVLKGLFWPIRATMRAVEENRLKQKAEDVLYDDEHTRAVLPTVTFLSSFGPSLGVTAFDDDIGGHGEQVQAAARFGGLYRQAYELSFRADRLFGSRLWVESLASYESRPRLLFQGVGDEPAEPGAAPGDPRAVAEKTRFHQERFLALERLGVTLGGARSSVKVGGLAMLSHRDLGPENDGGNDPSIEQVYDVRKLPGFDTGVTTVELGGSIVVDTRNVLGATSSGAYAEAFVSVVPRLVHYGYVHHGVEATGYFDLYRGTRVLVVRGVIEGVEGPTDRIPFTDLARLGGPTRLRGYALDRFRDEKAAVGTVEYLYPIHAFVSGALFVDAGRVAQSYDRLFGELGSFRVGMGAGLVVRSRDDVLFSLDVAHGEGWFVFLSTSPLRAFHHRETRP